MNFFKKSLLLSTFLILGTNKVYGMDEDKSTSDCGITVSPPTLHSNDEEKDSSNQPKKSPEGVASRDVFPKVIWQIIIKELVLAAESLDDRRWFIATIPLIGKRFKDFLMEVLTHTHLRESNTYEELWTVNDGSSFNNQTTLLDTLAPHPWHWNANLSNFVKYYYLNPVQGRKKLPLSHLGKFTVKTLAKDKEEKLEDIFVIATVIQQAPILRWIEFVCPIYNFSFYEKICEIIKNFPSSVKGFSFKMSRETPNATKESLILNPFLTLLSQSQIPITSLNIESAILNPDFFIVLENFIKSNKSLKKISFTQNKALSNSSQNIEKLVETLRLQETDIKLELLYCPFKIEDLIELFYTKKVKVDEDTIFNIGIYLKSKKHLEKAMFFFAEGYQLGHLKSLLAYTNILLHTGQIKKAEKILEEALFKKTFDAEDDRVINYQLQSAKFNIEKVLQGYLELEKDSKDKKSALGEIQYKIGSLIHFARKVTKDKKVLQKINNFLNDTFQITTEETLYKAAQSYYEKAIKNGYDQALLGLSKIYYINKNYEETINILKKAEGILSYETASIRFKLGHCYEKAGNKKEAKRMYKLAANKGNTYALLKLGILNVKNDKYDKARVFLNEAATFNNPYAKYWLAMVCKKENNKKDYFNFLQEAYKEENPKAIYELGYAAFLDKEYGESKKYFEECIKNYKSSDHIISLSYYMLGDMEKTNNNKRKYYNLSIKHDKSNYTAYFKLAKSLSYTKNTLMEALQNAETALQLARECKAPQKKINKISYFLQKINRQL